MIYNFNNFLNENFDPEIYRKDIECTGKAYRKFFINEILKMNENEILNELDKMDTQSLSNYYNYLYWGG